MQSCGQAYCYSCTGLDVEVAGLSSSTITASLPLTRNQTWANANVSIAYSAAIEAYLFRYNTVISAALPDTQSRQPFYSVQQTRWQPSTLLNTTGTVVIAAQCTSCPDGFYMEYTSSNPICTQVRVPASCLSGRNQVSKSVLDFGRLIQTVYGRFAARVWMGR